MDRYIFCTHNNKKTPFLDGKKAKDTRSSEIVWIKKREYNEDDGIYSNLLREICILRKITHTNIIRLRDVIIEDSKIAMIYEHHGIPLKHILDKSKTNLTIDQIKSYVAQLLYGIHHCHINRVIHRNLKLSNLLITRDGYLKITGFTYSRIIAPPIEAPLTHEVVTLWYRAPEVLLGCKTYALPVDIWSVGTILAEMVTKRPLFPGDSEVDTLFRIFRVVGTPNEQVWPGVTSLPNWQAEFPVWSASNIHMDPDLARLPRVGIELLERLLCMDPSRRISSEEALSHSVFLSDAIVCFSETHPITFGSPRNNTCIQGFTTPVIATTSTNKNVIELNNNTSSSNNNICNGYTVSSGIRTMADMS